MRLKKIISIIGICISFYLGYIETNAITIPSYDINIPQKVEEENTLIDAKDLATRVSLYIGESVDSVLNKIKGYYALKVVATAYAPYDNKSGICNDGDPNNTATGTKPKEGTLAVDPKEIPYGSIVYIPNYGMFRAEDTGSALRNDKENIRIDLFMNTYEQAMNFGKQEMTIYVIYKGDDAKNVN